LPLLLDRIEGVEQMKKIDIALLPHLRTGGGIHGSLKQQEVGGGACVAAVVALVSGG